MLACPRHLHLAQLLFLTCCMSLAFARKLRFSESGTFRMVQFADLHYGEAPDTDWGPEQDANSTRVIASVLDAERDVDLVLFLGDQVTGEDMVARNASLYIRQMLEPVVQRGIPVASIYGNHDHASALFSADDLLRAERAVAGRLSHTRRGPAGVGGVGNYVLRVYPYRAGAPALVDGSADARGARLQHEDDEDGDDDDDDDEAPLLALWFLDSRGNASHAPAADCVDASQVAWFEAAQQRAATANPAVPPPRSLVFFHVPVPAARALNSRRDFAAACAGFRLEPGALAVQSCDAGFPAALARAAAADADPDADADAHTAARSPRALLAAFSAHDHGAGWCCPADDHYYPVRLCFAKHSGYGGYGDWDRGARAVAVHADPARPWRTWIRMENGSVVFPSEF
ncbi:hypothetical protein HDU83_004300 [Entophlyctis luteolus]|nr:hypothetical protein HDU83_004300 [Entophlyctis luteolus]KAJ3383289.1 hypothetical protein HDU84_003731 [Entophlyctis sp. JEL0112]